MIELYEPQLRAVDRLVAALSKYPAALNFC